MERAFRPAATWIERLDPRRASLVVLAAAMAVSVVTLLYFGRGQYFSTDEWLYVGDFPGWGLGSLFHPDNGHLFVLANVVLNASLSLFGNDYLPLRVFSALLVQVNGGLVYLVVRRRVGPVLALAPAVLLLFLGSSYEIVLQAFSINSLMAIGFGLCAMLALDREDRRGDVIAGAMLVLSVLSFEWGLFFAAGAAVEMWTRPNRPPPARFAIVAIPFAIWLAWRAWAPSEPGDDITLLNIGTLFTSIGLVSASMLASITGLFRVPNLFSPTIEPDWGIPLAVAAAIGLVAWLRSGLRPSARFYSLATSLFLFWLSLALTVSMYRGPTTNRYVYGDALIFFLLVAEMLRGVRIPHSAYAAVAAVLAFSLVANFVQLRDGGSYVRGIDEVNDAKLGALEIVRGQVSPGFRADAWSPGESLTVGLTVTAAQYFSAADEHGAFGTSPAGLLSAGGAPAAAADQTIARALGVAAEPVAATPLPGTGKVAPANPVDGGDATDTGRCLRIDPSLGRSATATITLPPGGFSVEAPRYSELPTSLGRFSTEFPVDLGAVFGSAVVAIPTDRSEQPWVAKLASARSFTVCPLPAGGN